MTQLAAQLRRSGRLGAAQLETAFRRQQIYGGSLDTVLLELELLSARELLEELSAMSGLPPAPVELLTASAARPWDEVPRDLVDLGWVMPLARHDGKLIVICHPDLPDDRLADLRRAVANVTPTVAPECMLAKLAGERTESVVPQRYAVLAVRVLQELRPRRGGAAAPPVPAQSPVRDAPAPWLSGNNRPIPTDAEPPQPAASEDSFAGMLDDDDDAPQRGAGGWNAPRERTAPAEAAPAPRVFNPPAQADVPSAKLPERTGPVPVAPPVRMPSLVRPASPGSTPASASAPTGAVAGVPAAVSVDESAYASAQARLEAASDRDQITRALLDAAAALGPRAALFSVRKDGLHVMHRLPDLPLADDDVIPLGPTLEEGLSGQRSMQQVRDLDLRLAVGLERPDPCVFEPVLVRGRAVLVLYLDREGAPFDAQDRERARALCGMASRGLEGVLSRRVAQRASGSGSGEPSPPPASAPPVPTTSPRPSPAVPAPTPAAPSIPPAGSLSADSRPAGVAGPGPLLAPPPSTGKGSPGQADPPRHEAAPGNEGAPAPAPAPMFARPPVRSSPTAPSQAPPGPQAGAPGSGGPVVPNLVAGTGARTSTPIEPEALPQLVAQPPSHRSTTLTGHEGRPQLTFTPPSRAKTAPPIADGPMAPPVRFNGPPPNHAPASPPTEEDEVDPMKTTLVGGTHPPVAPPRRPEPELASEPSPSPASTTRGPIVALSQPLSQPTTRGRLAIDDGDDEQVGFDLGSESLTAKIDKSLDRVMRDLTAPGELEQYGDAALMRIAATFPGPLDVIRRDIDALPPPSAHGPLLRLCIRLGPRIAPYLIELMDHPNQTLRFFSAFVFQELRDARCMPALAERAFDPDNDVRTVAMRVLETYSRDTGYEQVAATVRDELDSTNVTRQIHAARAAGTLRDTRATPKLIEALGSRDRYLQEAALESLCSITGQQLGLKAHRWRAWYGDHGDEHRVEWIISSLTHKDVSVRRWAGDELRRITGQPFVFPAAADRTQRDAAIRQWRDWWQTRGKTELAQQT